MSFIPPAPKRSEPQKSDQEIEQDAPAGTAFGVEPDSLPPVSEIPAFDPEAYREAVQSMGVQDVPSLSTPVGKTFNLVSAIKWGLFLTAVALVGNDFFTAWLVHFFH